MNKVYLVEIDKRFCLFTLQSNLILCRTLDKHSLQWSAAAPVSQQEFDTTIDNPLANVYKQVDQASVETQTGYQVLECETWEEGWNYGAIWPSEEAARQAIHEKKLQLIKQYKVSEEAIDEGFKFTVHKVQLHGFN